MGYLEWSLRVFSTSSGVSPAPAAFQRLKEDILYVCICSGDFSSSEKALMSPRAASNPGL